MNKMYIYRAFMVTKMYAPTPWMDTFADYLLHIAFIYSYTMRGNLQHWQKKTLNGKLNIWNPYKNIKLTCKCIEQDLPFKIKVVW